jgi:guanylate kinase
VNTDVKDVCRRLIALMTDPQGVTTSTNREV